MFRHLVFITLLIGVSACASLKGGKSAPRKLSEEAYLSWYSSAAYPFRDTVEQNGIQYICALVPRELEIARQLNSQVITEADAAALLKEEDNVLGFQLQVVLPQAGTDVLHYQLQTGESQTTRTTYFSFGMKEDLLIHYHGLEPITCNALHFERGISNLPVSRIMAYFPRKNETITSVSFNSRIFSGPEISFEFKDLTTNRLPQLNL